MDIDSHSCATRAAEILENPEGNVPRAAAWIELGQLLRTLRQDAAEQAFVVVQSALAFFTGPSVEKQQALVQSLAPFGLKVGPAPETTTPELAEAPVEEEG